MPVTHGGMQPFTLTLDKFLEHAAKWHPTTEVVTGRADGATDRIGYAGLLKRSLQTSAVLRHFGIRVGDCVATLAWNTQAHIEVWYAIMGMGAVCHTLNPRLVNSQLAAMVTQSQARILIVSADLTALAEEIAERASCIERLLIIDALEESMGIFPDRGVLLEPLVTETRGDTVNGGDFDETAPSALCFTSGTTGAPKGVTYTHRSSFLHTLRLLQTDVMGISAVDSVLAVVPMFHANAWGLPFAAPAAGAKLVLPGRHADGATLARLIAQEGVTIAVGVPTVWLGLVEHIEACGSELPTLERIIMGGAPLAGALMERLERRLGVTVQTSWGMTELSPSGTVSPLNNPMRSAALSGRPAVGVDLLLTDSDGTALPDQRNVEGHLRVRGAAVINRYFGDEREATDAGGWFPTGDLARIDGSGNLIIVGRVKDLIKSGGEWINPAELEALIGALPDVSHAACIGRPDPRWGERPILLVEMRGTRELSDEALLAPLQGRVPPWWIPDAIYRLARLPLASTGKIDKQLLRSEYGGVDAQSAGLLAPMRRADPD
jgi:acyl-CoA synthetase (AMP-forming)/AMP-acid ligase II